MVNVFRLLSAQRAGIKKEAFEKYESERKRREFRVKMQAEREAKEKAIKKKAKEKYTKKGTGLKGLGERVRKNQDRNQGTFGSGGSSSVFGGSTRNIHEGVGRNIWYDKPKKR